MLFVMKILLTGTGTSHGIPVIGCSCPVCLSPNRRDRRLRSGAVIYGDDGTTLAIDSGPEFRIQALRAKLKQVDALLLTHSHADHLHGLDDMRIFCKEGDLPVYGNSETLKDVRERFSYIFRDTQEGGGKPRITLHSVWDPALLSGEGTELPPSFRVGSVEVQPVPMFHGDIPATGWKIGEMAYLTDINRLPPASAALVRGVRHLIIDALRSRQHPTHCSFEEAAAIAARIGAENTWFTHICHDTSHNALKKISAALGREYPELGGKKIRPAWDGLLLDI
jgi:phosphoribosyl 1,2-cyclic phosphate phosphodiesterase